MCVGKLTVWGCQSGALRWSYCQYSNTHRMKLIWQELLKIFKKWSQNWNFEKIVSRLLSEYSTYTVYESASRLSKILINGRSASQNITLAPSDCQLSNAHRMKSIQQELLKIFKNEVHWWFFEPQSQNLVQAFIWLRMSFGRTFRLQISLEKSKMLLKSLEKFWR